MKLIRAVLAIIALLLLAIPLQADENRLYTRIAYVIDERCGRYEDTPTCPLEIGVFSTMTGQAVVYPLPGQTIDPHTLTRPANGDQIAFTLLPNESERTVIGLLDLVDGTIDTREAADPAAEIAAVSAAPARSLVAYTVRTPEQNRAHHLTLYDLDSGASRLLLEGYWVIVPPTWSPDGETLAVMAAPLEIEAGEVAFDTLLIDIATGGVNNVTPGDARSHNPVWSAAGDRIAFHMQAADLNWSIATAAADGSEIEPAAEAFSSTVPPQWASGDGALIYADYVDEMARVWLVELESGEAEIITQAPQISDFLVSPDGEQLAYVQSDSEQAALCVMMLADRQSTCYPDVQPGMIPGLLWLP